MNAFTDFLIIIIKINFYNLKRINKKKKKKKILRFFLKKFFLKN